MESFPHNETIHHIAQTHKVIGLWVLGALIVLAAWSFWEREQRPGAPWGFLILLAAATLLVFQGGDIGARMVYVQGAAVKPAVSVVSPPDEIEEFEENYPGQVLDMGMHHDEAAQEEAKEHHHSH
jgi:hypothetical protein